MADPSEKAVAKIGGMHCAGCALTIENKLKKLPGVKTVKVNFGAEKVFIQYNPAMVSLADIAQVIEKPGYRYLGSTGADGAALESGAPAKELLSIRNRSIIGLIAGSLLMGLSHFMAHSPVLAYLLFFTVTPLLAYLSYPIFLAAGRSLKGGTLTMDVMYAMGIGIAFLSSLLATFGWLGPQFIFYDTTVMLAAFLSLGRYLEARARGKTGQAIQRLIGLQPKTAVVIRGGEEQEVPLAAVQIGDEVWVKPGGHIPVDGRVTAGESYVDEAMISGEAVPLLKKPGSRVVGGTLNKNGTLRVVAEKVGEETFLAQIVKLIETVQGSKPAIQRLADKVVAYFIPVVLGLAILTFLFWWGQRGQTFLFALQSFIFILVVACPCALGLATPTAITVGIGRGAELGILFKTGEALELAPKITTVVLDKTGTLTLGRPEVTRVITVKGEESTFLALIASVEKKSEHPVAEAIVRYVILKGLPLKQVQAFEALPGKGVRASFEGQTIMVGNRYFIEEKVGAMPAEIKKVVEQMEAAAETIIIGAIDGQIAGLVSVADPLRASSAKAVAAFHRRGLKVMMLTGDNQQVAEAIASQVGIDSVVAGVLPSQKAAVVLRLQKEREVVAFVGDGLNDAPALAQADVGIAMGTGTDIAIDSGDIVLMKGDLLMAVTALQLSRKVMTRIKQNLFWAFAYNSLLLPIAAGVLYPIWGLQLKPEWGALAMALSSITVVGLSLLLKRFKPLLD